MDILGTGSKIKKIRTLRKMTMKELGLAVGFPKSSADVRIAQYESDKRAIKQDVLEKIAFALNVNPDFLLAPEPLGSFSLMQVLLSKDEENMVRFNEEEYTDLAGNKQVKISMSMPLLNPVFMQWNEMKKALDRGEITLEQYHEWRMNWPNKAEWMEDVNE